VQAEADASLVGTWEQLVGWMGADPLLFHLDILDLVLFFLFIIICKKNCLALIYQQLFRVWFYLSVTSD
jgi:hypothetical protein